MGWLAPRPGRFTPWKETRYPLYRRLGGPQGRSGRLWKISPPTGIRSPDRPACSESLYRLRYSGPHLTNINFHIISFFHACGLCKLIRLFLLFFINAPNFAYGLLITSHYSLYTILCHAFSRRFREVSVVLQIFLGATSMQVAINTLRPRSYFMYHL
jgi:hypothetical protein